jgi:hypothetical protein
VTFLADSSVHSGMVKWLSKVAQSLGCAEPIVGHFRYAMVGDACAQEECTHGVLESTRGIEVRFSTFFCFLFFDFDFSILTLFFVFVCAKVILMGLLQVGHVFYLGTKYSSKLTANVTYEGQSVPVEMGCY